MTTNSLYLILCVAGSLTLLAFTQNTTGSNKIAQAASTASTQSLANERPAMTNTVNPSTTSSTDNSTTATSSSTSTDYPVHTTTRGSIDSPSPQPSTTGMTTGGTTTTDIPTTGSTYSNPNY